MAKKSSVRARKKAVKKLDKAVRRAVERGVPQNVLEQTVNDGMERAVTKKPPVKRSTTRTSGRYRKRPAPTAKIQDDNLD